MAAKGLHPSQNWDRESLHGVFGGTDCDSMVVGIVVVVEIAWFVASFQVKRIHSLADSKKGE